MHPQSSISPAAIVEMAGPFTGTTAAGIYDRASRDGGYIHADQAHLKKAKEAARDHAWYIAQYEWEDEKGDDADRPGYNRILEHVKRGRIKVVIVADMARFSRGGWERIQRIEEIERHGGRIWRLDKQCYDEPGMGRYQEAHVDRDFLRQQAQKAIDNLPFAVAAKKMMGQLPTGLEREYRVSADKKSVEAVIVHHPIYAPLVRQAAQDVVGGMPVKAIVDALNAGAHPNPHRKDGRWTTGTLYSIFHTSGHAGLLTWGKRKRGRHLHYEGPVLKETLDCGPVIDGDLWQQLQQRLTSQRKGRYMNQSGYPAQLLDGLVRCAQCGEATYVHATQPKGHTYYQYVCAATKRGYRHCEPAGISAALADAAVLRQVERLSGQPWSDQAFEAALRTDPNEPLRQQLLAAMANVEERMAQLAGRISAMQDVGPHFMEAMKAEAGKLELEMQHLKDQHGAIPERAHDPVRARQLYQTLASVDLHRCVLDAQAKGDQAVLRDILSLVVQEARIVQRGYNAGQDRHATWARAAVTWTPNVELLLAAGRLTLADDPDELPRPSLKERKREAMRRYRERKRAEQV